MVALAILILLLITGKTLILAIKQELIYLTNMLMKTT